MASVRVLHLAGSPTSTFWAELSRVYAADCLRATAGLQDVEPVIAWLEPGGRWRFPDGLSPQATAAAPPVPLASALTRIADEQIDVMVPQLFCPAGMTHLRALFDVAGIPYVGNTGEVMALGADKAHARAVVAAAGVDVPAAEVVGLGRRPVLDLPVVVKPVDADNSAGLALVREPGELDAALSAALEHGPRALVERYVPAGREVRCGVLDLGDGPVALPLEEYPLDAATPIRLATDKIEASGSGLRLLAKGVDRAWIVPDDDPVVGAVQAAALQAHDALGCRDYSLFDFRIDPAGTPWFIEAGLYCSFADSSVVSTMARAAGWTTAGLFRACVDVALQRRTGAAPEHSPA